MKVNKLDVDPYFCDSIPITSGEWGEGGPKYYIHLLNNIGQTKRKFKLPGHVPDARIFYQFLFNPPILICVATHIIKKSPILYTKFPWGIFSKCTENSKSKTCFFWSIWTFCISHYVNTKMTVSYYVILFICFTQIGTHELLNYAHPQDYGYIIPIFAPIRPLNKFFLLL